MQNEMIIPDFTKALIELDQNFKHMNSSVCYHCFNLTKDLITISKCLHPCTAQPSGASVTNCCC